MKRRHPRKLTFSAGHAPMIGSIPIWPCWVADSRVILYGGALLAMYLSIVHFVTTQRDAWVPIAIVIFTSLPGIYDRIREAMEDRKDHEHAVAIQELRLEIELLKSYREQDCKTIATLTGQLDQSRAVIADHETNMHVLQGQLRDAREQIAQLTNQGTIE